MGGPGRARSNGSGGQCGQNLLGSGGDTEEGIGECSGMVEVGGGDGGD